MTYSTVSIHVVLFWYVPLCVISNYHLFQMSYHTEGIDAASVEQALLKLMSMIKTKFGYVAL